MQEAEITLLRCQQLYDSNKSTASFETYFTTAVRNKFRNLLHRAWHSQDSDDEHLTYHPDIVPEGSQAVDLVIALRNCTEEEKKVAQALYECGCVVTRTAEKLGFSFDIVDRYRRQIKEKIGL